MADSESRLTYLEEAGRSRNGKRRAKYACRCGNVLVILVASVKSGRTRSCGCRGLEKTVLRSTKHGMRRSPEYGIWQNIISRCENDNVDSYKNYGGRGIAICWRWRNSFATFYEDVGPRPSPVHTLERKDNDGNYEPGNVVWAERSVQANNRRDNHFLVFRGKRQTIAQWSRELLIDASLLQARISRLGWSPERALTTPARKLAR